MKYLLVAILVSLSLTVSAIGFSLPSTREILFEPNANISLEYKFSNPSVSEKSYIITATTSHPDIKLEETNKVYTLKSGEQAVFTLKAKLPEKLEPGFHHTSVQIQEERPSSVSMSAMPSAIDSVIIISPYDYGYPYSKFTLRERYTPGDTISRSIPTRNIGKTTINNHYANITLLENGKILKNIITDKVRLPSMSAISLPLEIPTTGLNKGEYLIHILLAGDNEDAEITRKVFLGSPILKVENSPTVQSGKENNVTLNFTVDWNAPMNATLRLEFEDGFFQSQPIQQEVVPGKNTITFTGTVSREKGPKNAELFITSDALSFSNQFIVTIERTGILGSLFNAVLGPEPTGDPEEEYPLDPTGAVRYVPAPEKNDSMLVIMLLLLGWTAFGFLLGKYLEHTRSERI